MEKLRPDELVCPRSAFYQIFHHETFFLPSFKATGERTNGKSWKLVVYHLRGFCINMTLCKMWGSNERHFYLWDPYVFCKEFYLQGSKYRRALMMPSSEMKPFYKEEWKAQVAACNLELAFFSSTKEGKGEEDISWAPPRHFHIQSTSFRPHHNPVRCDFTCFVDEEIEAQGRGKAPCPSPWNK